VDCFQPAWAERNRKILLALLRRAFDPEYLVKDGLRAGALPTARAAYGETLRIALPSVAEMVLISMIGSADTIMVGGLGEGALSSVGLPTQPRMITLSVFFALNIGVTAIIARRHGEERRDEANRTLRNSLLLSLLLSLAIMGLALAFAGPLILLAGGSVATPEDMIIFGDAVAYFRIMAYALPINAMAMCINAAQRGTGNTGLTMRVNVTSNLVNIVFNYLLIGGELGFPRLEVRGAAIASVIGIATGSLLSFMAVMRRRGKDDYLHIALTDDWRFNGQTMRSITKVGGNAMIEQLGMRFGFFVYSRIIAGLGWTMFAGHQICMQFLNLTFTFGDGLGIAGTALVGRYMGRARADLSLLYGRICQRLGLIVSCTLGVLLLAFRVPLASLFIGANTPNANLVVVYVAETMVVLALLQPFQISAVILSGCLRGAGDNLYVAAVMMICVNAIRPLMTLLAVNVFGFGLALTWLLSLAEIILRFGFFYNRFSGGKWKDRKV
jgi:putative MATE family efflux protein